MRPELGRLNPAIAISNVVFPEPDGPSNVKNSPALTSMLTEFSAKTLPYDLVNSVTEIDSEEGLPVTMMVQYLYYFRFCGNDTKAGAFVSSIDGGYSLISSIYISSAFSR